MINKRKYKRLYRWKMKLKAVFFPDSTDVIIHKLHDNWPAFEKGFHKGLEDVKVGGNEADMINGGMNTGEVQNESHAM